MQQSLLLVGKWQNMQVCALYVLFDWIPVDLAVQEFLPALSYCFRVISTSWSGGWAAASAAWQM